MPLSLLMFVESAVVHFCMFQIVTVLIVTTLVIAQALGEGLKHSTNLHELKWAAQLSVSLLILSVKSVIPHDCMIITVVSTTKWYSL